MIVDALDKCAEWIDRGDKVSTWTIMMQRAASLARQGRKADAIALRDKVDNMKRKSPEISGDELLFALKILVTHLRNDSKLKVKYNVAIVECERWFKYCNDQKHRKLNKEKADKLMATGRTMEALKLNGGLRSDLTVFDTSEMFKYIKQIVKNRDEIC